MGLLRAYSGLMPPLFPLHCLKAYLRSTVSTLLVSLLRSIDSVSVWRVKTRENKKWDGKRGAEIHVHIPAFPLLLPLPL